MNPKPYVAVATICERVLEEKEGTLSAIRIVDTVKVEVPETIPADAKPVINLSALVSLKSGDARGKFLDKIVSCTPSGKKLEKLAPSFPLLLQGGERGANLVVNFSLQISEWGLYWFDVLLNDELISRMPLTVQREVSEAKKKLGNS